MANLKYYRKWAKIHPNFMTPHIIRLYDRGVFIIELSEGTGMQNESIFGVTIAKMEGSNFVTQGHKFDELNKMFFSQSDAVSYIKQISKKVR